MKKITCFLLVFLCILSGCSDTNDNLAIMNQTVNNEEEQNESTITGTEKESKNRKKEKTKIESEEKNTKLVSEEANLLTKSFEINIGDGEHEFYVEMRAIPYQDDREWLFYDSDLIITVYDIDDKKTPVQVIEDTTLGTLFRDLTIVDANFDGNLDFYYIDNRGNANYYCRFWIWDITTESFVESYELNELSTPQFYEETKIVSAFWRDSAVSSETRYYKYIDSKLTSIRYFDIGYPFENESGECLHTLRVEDFIDGELVEVFNKDTLVTEEFSGEIYDEFFRWWDLNYYGE